MTKVYFFFFFLWITPLSSNGQTLIVNKGSILSIKGATTVAVRGGGVLNDINGFVLHAGHLLIEGNFVNNHIFENIGASTLEIQANFTNHRVFKAGESRVKLYGGIQSIGGSSHTVFHDLEMLGTGVKILKTNTEVKHQLLLNHLELATENYQLTVTNADTNAIIRTTGFISSLGMGALARSTNSDQHYLFPVGSSLFPARYRPIVIRPTDNQFNTFGVRFANANAVQEGFDLQNLDNHIESFNTNYYHRIYQLTGQSVVDISFYPLLNDGRWNAVSYWDSNWRNINNQITNLKNTITLHDWELKSYIPYLLVKTKAATVFIPNTFSPNGDGNNDFFTVFAHEKITVIKSMIIFDRWGNLVYSAKDLTPNKDAGFWDGTFKGSKLDSDVFVYLVTVLMPDGSDEEFSGSVTILK